MTELELEQQSHDAEINRIAAEIYLPQGSTVEDIVRKLKIIKRFSQVDRPCIPSYDPTCTP